MNEDILCPFSKPIIGQWCQCSHARVADRCSGKMICIRADEYRKTCLVLVGVLKKYSRFVLGLSRDDVELTHAQLMKIRCGGLMGMQRLLKMTAGTPPAVTDVIAAAESQYGEIERFPFNEVVKDIQAFSHRKK